MKLSKWHFIIILIILPLLFIWNKKEAIISKQETLYCTITSTQFEDIGAVMLKLSNSQKILCTEEGNIDSDKCSQIYLVVGDQLIKQPITDQCNQDISNFKIVLSEQKVIAIEARKIE